MKISDTIPTSIFLGLIVIASFACGPTGPDPFLIEESNRGVALMGRFDYGGALEVFSDLAEKYPENPDVLVNQAIATLNRQSEGDEVQAIAILDRALELDEGNLRAHYCRGLLELHGGEAEAAIADFGAVAEADPLDPDAVYFMGQCLMQLDRTDDALDYYQRAIELDPYLRSAYYRAFQTLQRLGRRDEAMATLETFRKLENNPRGRLVEFKYTRMGRRGEARPLGGDRSVTAERPSGPLFDEAATLAAVGATWRDGTQTDAPVPSLSMADLNGDDLLDLFMAAAVADGGESTNAVLLGRGGNEFAFEKNHPLAVATAVNAALWGDLDNDGLTDVYLCRRGPNELWRGLEGGDFVNATSETGTSGGESNTVDGSLVDADHDGDLDIFLVNADGPNDLLNNDRDGGYRSLAAELGLEGVNADSRSVLFADLDSDRDADIVVISSSGEHEVLTNDLLWSYRRADGFDAFRDADIKAAVAGDLDSDGHVELYSLAGNGLLRTWSPGADGSWQALELARLDGTGPATAPRLALADLDGDGVIEILATTGSRIAAVSPSSGEILATSIEGTAWTTAVLDPGRGPSLIAWNWDAPPTLYGPGTGRFDFASLEISGQEDDSAALRSNASGIGTHLAVRVGGRWTVTDTFRRDSGPGQSLQPTAVGLGGAPAVDFVAIEWSDGVFQTEMNLTAGETHRLTETQRQLSSCPVLFAWDGEDYTFVSDLLGVGGIGFAIGPGEYAEPRPWENFLLPAGLPTENYGRLVLKLGEPMEEATYLDAARLVAYDLPPGWSMVVDDRMGILGPAPTGGVLFYREGVQPVEAINERHEIVTETILERDLRGAPVGSLDRRFIGLLEGEHVLTLLFAGDLNEMGETLALVADGWIEYPYSQTAFAAWQADAHFEAPTLEARGSDGRWVRVYEQFGYPAGMPRRMAVPLPPLPKGTRELRLRTNQEIYWDRLEIVAVKDCPEVKRVELALEEARLLQTGFAYRTTGAQHLPHYDYARRAPVWDTRSQTGWYTRLGAVDELLRDPEGAYAIFGPGEEIHMEFAAPAATPADGWQRRYVFESEGWCKDMDLFTKDGETVAPLPGAERGGERRAALLEKFNTRYREGRD